MYKRFAAIAMLVGIVSLAAVACGGDGDEDAAAPPPAAAAAPTGEAAAAAPPPAAAAAPTGEAAAAAPPPPAAAAEPDAVGTVLPPEIAATATTGDAVEVADNRPPTAFAADLSKQGDVIDFTVGIREDAVEYARKRAGIWFEPDEMTFKVGQTVNFTIKPRSDSTKSFSFTVTALDINEKIKFGNPASFTYTFDKAGRYRLRSIPGEGFGMIGVIRVVE